jgi:hypothetical protein
VVAAGIGLAASSLVSQPIGLPGEPVTAGGDLAPAPARPSRTREDEREQPVRTTETRAPSRPQPDDEGGEEPGEAPDGDD